MSLHSGERQVAPNIEGIRNDHVARYVWAARTLPKHCRVIDIACGVGYGTHLLALAGYAITGFDIDAEAIEYARQHYGHCNAAFVRLDAAQAPFFESVDAAVCFETIEHIADPAPLLGALHGASVLLASVPNEEAFPFTGQQFHHRHYRPVEFEALLNECGWKIAGWFTQDGPESDVHEGIGGRTTVVKAVRV